MRARAIKALAAIPDKEKSDAARGVQILVSFLLLQTYDEVEDALDLLEEAVGAAERMFAKKTKAKKGEAEAEAAPPIDALLDGLIALLDKNSADLRALANLVFGMVAPSLTASSIQHLVAQLEQSGAAQEAEEEDEDEDDDAEDDAEDDDDEDDSASSISIESDDGNAEVDPEFRKRVAEALKASGMGVDEDADADSDDESVWDDEQMMKVDEQLAAVFKSHAQGNKRADLKHAAIESLHFKNRILDFFDTFARRQCASPVALDILVPLLRLSRAGGELANKAAGILRTRIAKAAHAPAPASVDAEHAKAIIAEIHNMARKAPTAEFSALCSAAALFAARAAPATALDAYTATLEDFMTRKQSGVHAAFVAEYVRRHPAKAWALADALTRYVAPSAEGAATAANAFRQAQGYAMLSTLATQLPALVKAGDVSTADAERVVSAAMADIYATLEAAAGPDAEAAKADRLKEVAKFALVIARAARALDAAHAAQLCDAARLASVTEVVRTGRTKDMKGVQGLLAQLGSMLGQKKEKEGKKGKKADEEEVKEAAEGAEEAVEVAKPKKRKAEGKAADQTKAKAKAKKAKV
jgi:DNA polymerase phi